MHEWLLDMWDLFDGEGKNWVEGDVGRLGVCSMPGWLYARALGLRLRENAKNDADHDASDEALRVAIRSFPSIVPLLADKAEMTLSSEVRAHPSAKIVTEYRYLISIEICYFTWLMLLW